MSEKVLGFKEKDSGYNSKAWLCGNCGMLHEEEVKECCSDNPKIKLVPVRLKSESVSVERLEKLVKERPCVSCDWVEDLLCAVRKEANKK